MSDFTITVGLSNGKLTVSQASLKNPKGGSSSVTWVPADNGVQIRFIGFYQPTSSPPSPETSPVTTPAPSTGNPQDWACQVYNDYTHAYAEFFYYTVYAEVGGVIYCTDPEIENEPNS